MSLFNPSRPPKYACNPGHFPHYSHFSKNRRIASIEASKILSWPRSHLSTVESDTPSSREIRTFFHSDWSANVRNRVSISAFSRSLRDFSAASIDLVKGDSLARHTKRSERFNSKQQDFPTALSDSEVGLGCIFPLGPRPLDHPRRRRDYQVSLQNKNLAVKLSVPKKFTANIANMAPPECQPVGCPERAKVFYETADLLIAGLRGEKPNQFGLEQHGRKAS